MKHTTTKHSLTLLGIALFMMVLLGSAAASQSAIVHGRTTDIRIWVADEDEIYPNIDDVVCYIRAADGCHALIYIVDTEGFIHVLHPFSPYEDAWIEGGVTYRITAREAGLYGFDYDRGIAFVFAVGSPYPFDYSVYGAGIFAGRFAYRIYGDPFIACQRFYVSLLPARCDRAFIGVSFSHFYVREWMRYPRYLCVNHSWPYVDHGRSGRYSQVFDGYRQHMRDPYQVLNPAVRYKGDADEDSRIVSVPPERSESLRAKRSRTAAPVPAANQGIESISLKNKKEQVRETNIVTKVKDVGPVKNAKPVSTRQIATRATGRENLTGAKRPAGQPSTTAKNRTGSTTRTTKQPAKSAVREPVLAENTEPTRTRAAVQKNGKSQLKFTQTKVNQDRSESGRVISKASQVKQSRNAGRSKSKSDQSTGRNHGR
jgi:hypothetical protein